MTTETDSQAQAASEVPTEQTASLTPEVQAAIDAKTDAVTSGATSEEIAALDQSIEDAKAKSVPAEQTTTETTATTTDEATATTTDEATGDLPSQTPEEIAAAKAAEDEAKALDEAKISNRPRLTHLSEPDKAKANAIILLTRSGLSLAEATQRVLGTQTSTETATEVESAPSQTAQLEAEVAGLETKLDEAGAAEGLYNSDIANLTKQLSRANAKLEARRMVLDQPSVKEVVDDAQFVSERQKVIASTVNDYPAMKDRTSALWRLSSQIAREMQDKTSPEYKERQEVHDPRIAVERAAKLLAIKPVGALVTAVVQQPTTQTVAAKPGPAPGSRQSAPPPPAKTAAEIAAISEARTLAITEGREYVPFEPKNPRFVRV